MATIRPLVSDDVTSVADLLRTNVPGWGQNEEILAATVLEHPWQDDELCSLVAVDGAGGVVGFIGAQTRRMRFDGRPARGVCCTQLVVSSGHRRSAAGALLMAKLLRGPQDVTWSDASTDTVVRVWRRLGGHVDHARSADFMLLLRPVGWARSIAAAAIRGRRINRHLVPVGSIPVSAARPRFGRWKEPPRDVDVEGEMATPASIAEHLETISAAVRLQVAWDEPQLAHMFKQVEACKGPLVSRLVRRRGKAIGWYAYLPNPGGVSRLLHLAAAERTSEAVLDELVDHARSTGGAALAGRAEPHLEWPLRKRIAALGFARQPIVHTRNAELAGALATDASLLTRLEGEVFSL